MNHQTDAIFTVKLKWNIWRPQEIWNIFEYLFDPLWIYASWKVNALQSCLCLPSVRCGAGIQNRQPKHLGDHHPHHAHLKQPQPAGWSSLPSPHLRVGRPRHGAWEKQRWTRGTPRSSSKAGTRTQEDKGREWVISFGGALPISSLRQRPVVHHHCCQRGKNLQVAKDLHLQQLISIN